MTIRGRPPGPAGLTPFGPGLSLRSVTAGEGGGWTACPCTTGAAPRGDRVPANRGWVEVICGSMFSGKSEELIRRLVRARIARQQVQAFKPAMDDRFAKDHVVSHSGQRIPSVEIESAADILRLVQEETRAWSPSTRPSSWDWTSSRRSRSWPISGLARHRGRSGPGLPRPPVRAGTPAHGHRGECDEGPRPSAWSVGIRRAGRSASWTRKIASSSVPGEAYEARCRECWTPDPARGRFGGRGSRPFRGEFGRWIGFVAFRIASRRLRSGLAGILRGDPDLRGHQAVGVARGPGGRSRREPGSWARAGSRPPPPRSRRPGIWGWSGT